MSAPWITNTQSTRKAILPARARSALTCYNRATIACQKPWQQATVHAGGARRGTREALTLRPSPAAGSSRNSVTSARSSASCLYSPALTQRSRSIATILPEMQSILQSKEDLHMCIGRPLLSAGRHRHRLEQAFMKSTTGRTNAQ